MTGPPGNFRITKGAIIAIDSFNPLASIVVFQFNPDQLKRTLKPQTQKTGTTPVGTQRLAGPPDETIDFTLEINAVDQLDAATGLASGLGIYPQLSALETLIFPKTALVIADAARAALGIMEITPPESAANPLRLGGQTRAAGAGRQLLG